MLARTHQQWAVDIMQDRQISGRRARRSSTGTFEQLRCWNQETSMETTASERQLAIFKSGWPSWTGLELSQAKPALLEPPQLVLWQQDSWNAWGVNQAGRATPSIFEPGEFQTRLALHTREIPICESSSFTKSRTANSGTNSGGMISPG